MERTERERTVLRQENARLKREVGLWKMKAQVAESGRHIADGGPDDGSDQTHRAAGVDDKHAAQVAENGKDDDDGDDGGGESRASSGLYALV